METQSATEERMLTWMRKSPAERRDIQAQRRAKQREIMLARMSAEQRAAFEAEEARVAALKPVDRQAEQLLVRQASIEAWLAKPGMVAAAASAATKPQVQAKIAAAVAKVAAERS